MSERTQRILLLAVALIAAFTFGTCVGGGETQPNPTAAGAHVEAWTCSMHPNVRQNEPGSCPICGMDLIPATQDAGASPDVVRLSPRAQALAKLRTTPVQRQSGSAAQLRLLGRIEPAESTRRNVTTWIGGRIDRLQVNTTGERIRRGQTIATLYSPEVYAAHQDLITATTQVGRLKDAGEDAQGAARSALRAARERLRLLGVPDDELETLAQAAEPTRTIDIRSPFGGTVIERVATEGAYVETGATLYRVADLGTLWVQLDAYESDLPRLAVGQQVQLKVEALPGERFAGRIDFIEPTVDTQKRTAQVRVVVDNPEGQLRPGMFAEAVIDAAPSEASPLVIPDTAPLFTGRRSVVYVEQQTDNGPVYAPRTVRLGPRLGDVYPVVSGLSAGEVVVSRGAFALDADLQIRGGPSMMTHTDGSAAAPPVPLAVTPAQRLPLAPVLDAYLKVQRALAEDDLPLAKSTAQDLVEAVAAVSLPPALQDPWTPLRDRLSRDAGQLATATSLEQARGGFEPLSAAVQDLLVQFGNPLDRAVQVAFCPMAMDDEGARWVQANTTVDNAYFGDAMRTCGDIEATISPGTHLDPAELPQQVRPSHAGHNH